VPFPLGWHAAAIANDRIRRDANEIVKSRKNPHKGSEIAIRGKTMAYLTGDHITKLSGVVASLLDRGGAQASLEEIETQVGARSSSRA